MRSGEPAAGWAGGERGVTRTRIGLSGLLAALKDLTPGAAVSIVAPEADARMIHSLIRPHPDRPPSDEPDLRTAVAIALKGHTCTLAVGDPTGATPLAFAAAWAELAEGKARASGPFVAAIPRANLAKIRGL